MRDIVSSLTMFCRKMADEYSEEVRLVSFAVLEARKVVDVRSI